MGSIQVIKPGFQSTIQDLGRYGFRKIGVPTSGAMDLKSMLDANQIVGNDESNPVIEHTFYGGVYQFNEAAIISITGAICNPTVNSVSITQYESIKIEKEDILEIQYPSRGCRSYLAIQGRPKIQQVMNSYSTYLPGRFGGFDGRSLQKGDLLKWDFSSNESLIRNFKKEEIPYFSSKVSIAVEKGPEFDLLDASYQEKLFSTSHEVTSDSNRMGIRLQGEEIEVTHLEMTSSPVIPGIIQIPPSGNPIILMKDAQTIGGYPRIGLINESDLWRIGQVKTGDLIRFTI